MIFLFSHLWCCFVISVCFPVVSRAAERSKVTLQDTSWMTSRAFILWENHNNRLRQRTGDLEGTTAMPSSTSPL